MRKHTPGPWDKTLKKGDRTYIGSQEKPVAEICPLYGAESAANAHLIKAAPEMLEALEDILQSYEGLVRDGLNGATMLKDYLRQIDAAKAAIAKAKGAE